MTVFAHPLVIAHRGCPGLRLEHTRPSYDLAINDGADYIEPDVVASRDGYLVVRHENEIGSTTDVADHPEFADRRATKIVDSVEKDGWFTEDFTLAELKTLRATERIPEIRPDNVALAGSEQILTFDDVVAIAEEGTARRGTPVGVYVETKHPTYFQGLGLDLNDLLVDALERLGLNHEDAPVIIQSFESCNLQDLRRRSPLFLVQLASPKGSPADFVATGDPRTYADLMSAEGLEFVAGYAHAIGPFKNLVIPLDDSGNLGEPSGLVERAHAAGLDVHIWTMRDENAFLPANLRLGTGKADYGDMLPEYLAFLEAGIDGMFSDFTRTAVRAREAWGASVADSSEESDASPPSE
ncbi:glycerophosphodiester phosphodiesterase [Aeromicrobium sp.]|uniref:glycerophosphodiester phosphodiesterase n=1 Tax=Aeromicrobium sp. TaxID=1871063 RepID=UPI003D6A48DA